MKMKPNDVLFLARLMTEPDFASDNRVHRILCKGEEHARHRNRMIAKHAELAKQKRNAEKRERLEREKRAAKPRAVPFSSPPVASAAPAALDEFEAWANADLARFKESKLDI